VRDRSWRASPVSMRTRTRSWGGGVHDGDGAGGAERVREQASPCPTC
jgi:hypothetical protein